MRKLTTYILIIFWIGVSAQEKPILESAQIENQVFDKDRLPIIRGKLLHYNADDFHELSIEYSYPIPSLKKSRSKSSNINHDGSFDLPLEFAFGFQEVFITVGDYYFGRLIVQKDLAIELDLSILKSSPVIHTGEGVHFTGSDAKLNVFINTYELFKQDKREEIEQEKMSIIMDNALSKLEKEKELKKIYKKQGILEHQFAKKNGKQFEWILANDRIAAMYADLCSIHWGKKMNDLLNQEILAFRPALLTNATIQYYDFLGLYYRIPNRIEIKMLTERTLRAQLDESTSSEHLDLFLREYDKKRDHLRYDEEVFSQGEVVYLDRYENELKMANLKLHFDKMNRLSKEKADIVKLLSQPEDLRLRALYINEIKEDDPNNWIISIMEGDLDTDHKIVEDLSSKIKANVNSDSISLGIETNIQDCFVADAIDIQSLFSMIKSKYPNKAIILDLWAPWTPVCKDDLIRNTTFVQAIDTLPVQMVYLCSSMDVSKLSWEKELSTFPVAGTHIYLNDKLTAQLMELFQIRKYPTYFFIDQEGNFDKDFIPNLSQFNPRKLAQRVSISERI